MESLTYSILIRWSAEDNCFFATVPEIARLTAHGETRAEALAEIEKVIATYIDICNDNSWELPVPALIS